MNRREREVRRYASDVLQELDVTTVPVDPVWIARKHGLSVDEKPLPSGVFGALWKRRNGFGIVVSDSCPTAGHRRFSVAHELGHYHVDGHVDGMFSGTTDTVVSQGGLFRDQSNRLEREADWFASELLVPATQVVPRFEKGGASVETIRCLAGEFETSLSMMAIRYTELTDRAAASILSMEGRVEWAVSSQRVREHDWSWGLRKRELVPPKTATWGLARDQIAVHSRELRSAASLVCEWFEGAPSDLEVEEDAVGLGSYGRVLTFLLFRDLPDPDDLDEPLDDEEPGDWRDAMRGYRMD